MGTKGAKNILNSPASLISKEFPDNQKPTAVGFSVLFFLIAKYLVTLLLVYLKRFEKIPSFKIQTNKNKK